MSDREKLFQRVAHAKAMAMADRNSTASLMIEDISSLFSEMARITDDAHMYREHYDRAVGDRDIALGLLREVIWAAGGVAHPGCTVDFLRVAPKEIASMKAERDSLRLELTTAREALEPFGKYAASVLRNHRQREDKWAHLDRGEVKVTYGDLRRVIAALRAWEKEGAA